MNKPTSVNFQNMANPAQQKKKTSEKNPLLHLQRRHVTMT